jgi:hypothetical protein
VIDELRVAMDALYSSKNTQEKDATEWAISSVVPPYAATKLTMEATSIRNMRDAMRCIAFFLLNEDLASKTHYI